MYQKKNFYLDNYILFTCITSSLENKKSQVKSRQSRYHKPKTSTGTKLLRILKTKIKKIQNHQITRNESGVSYNQTNLKYLNATSIIPMEDENSDIICNNDDEKKLESIPSCKSMMTDLKPQNVNRINQNLGNNFNLKKKSQISWNNQIKIENSNSNQINMKNIEPAISKYE
ncbi:hypothetical protein CWI36_0886p0010 [Hamiltosporidium magnivora]|uniref:Uncharacterized protein n=1 Tax=Hamiltosporidium magnivora TaxID=148818 RepID=A0A4Q9L7I6_9MICR|nr:hypothetical protein CWI36_0886p0010 [Hamiltosporidium magnivora]